MIEQEYKEYINYLNKYNYLMEIETCLSNHEPLVFQKAAKREILINKLLEMISIKMPFSLIRLGDGEGNILLWGIHKKNIHTLALNNLSKSLGLLFGKHKFEKSDYDKLYELMSLSIIESNILGLPTIHQEKKILDNPFNEPINIRGNTGYLGVWDWLLKKDICCNTHKKIITNSHFHTVIGENISSILNNNISVSLITCYPELLDSLAKNFRIKKGESFLIPPQASNTKKTPENSHFHDVFNDIIKEIESKNLSGQLYLVGAGVLGKIYCAKIKQSGGMAIDVGSMMDAWIGEKARNYHNDDFITKHKLNN